MMRKKTNLFLGVSLCALMVLSGCDWEDGGAYNTSKGAGVDVNISGMYTAQSGELVAGQAISSFLISQIGNSIEVRDSNNSFFTGSVGAPGVMANVSGATGAYPPGATMLQAQISFTGKNALTKKTVNFAGIIRAVALEDVRGNTVTATTTSTRDQVRSEATNTLGVTSIDIIAPPVTLTDSTTTTGEDSSGTSVNAVTIQEQTTTFIVTDANTLFILEGHWVEGSAVSAVSGAARSSAGSFSTAATTTL